MHAHRHRPRISVLAGALVAAALSAGCGDASEGAATTATATPRTVDDAEVEQGIKDDISTSSAEVTAATCPSDVAVERGDTFTCSVTFDNGAAGKASVTQAGAGTFVYELKPGSVQIPGETVDAAVETSLAAQGIPGATVTCPDPILVEVGTTVSCDVAGAQGVATGSVTFTFSSAEGTVDPSSVET
jgi:hypothetical protein